jgi:esterase/lipase superfamily enzyme
MDFPRRFLPVVWLMRYYFPLLNVIVLIAALVSLAACAGRPQGVLLATHKRPDNVNLVNMLVVTTRAPDDMQEGVMFGGDRANHASFANIIVSVPPDANRLAGEIQWPAEKIANPSYEFSTVEAKILTQDEAMKDFDQRIRKTPKRQVLIFVHGFNTKFEEAVYRFAQIIHDANADVVPVLFTWPSRGNLLQYGYDHESASYSRDALENTLQVLARDPSVGEISILAHSMGNWVTLEALRQMSIRNHALPTKIQNIMLAAPDVDFDVFRRQIAAIGVKPSLFTLFVSRDDEALAVSRRVWGNKPRLGAVNTADEPYQEALDRDRIQIVDLTDVASGDRLGHTKFAQAPAVVRAIGGRLAQGQTLNDGKAGVGQRLGLATAGAVATVGTAAGVAVAAPFAIIDPHTREQMNDHLDSLGAQLAP